mmetsp:Transcript_169/g.382  ORF Transcript_169/g.382 Transcript_169/m.382 type:complete len:241 (-) Transcript_169:602-1324(-)
MIVFHSHVCGPIEQVGILRIVLGHACMTVDIGKSHHTFVVLHPSLLLPTLLLPRPPHKAKLIQQTYPILSQRGEAIGHGPFVPRNAGFSFRFRTPLPGSSAISHCLHPLRQSIPFPAFLQVGNANVSVLILVLYELLVHLSPPRFVLLTPLLPPFGLVLRTPPHKPYRIQQAPPLVSKSRGAVTPLIPLALHPYFQFLGPTLRPRQHVGMAVCSVERLELVEAGSPHDLVLAWIAVIALG